MNPVRIVSGVVAPLDRANVDTDQIIPKQFLKSIRRTGFGDYLFDAWRFLDEGDLGMTPNERRINHDFVLNQPRYQGARILLARENFGCGSSREHAVWSLMEFGFGCVIAPSFADIFFSNCFKNGLLPVVLDAALVDELFRLATGPAPLELTVDLPEQTIRLPDGRALPFAIDADRKRTLLEGLDEIQLTLAHGAAIEAFEARHRARMPWLFRSNHQKGASSV
ncbi:MAG: 3-isopropylmalate dehydratase small subunit [Pseudomonadales bacterium]|nr:3-isopropylmalate dehydratase small subunit [Pseudomonadales bacterium]